MALLREILIVDDEVGIRELLSEILEDEGYRVATAENASEARAYRLRAQPALVLLDIWMPDTDGVTLLREWAGNGLLTMPVVMMSGHGTIETAVDATKIGAFDFLEKPIGLSKLLATIARAFKMAASQEPRHVSLAALGSGAAVRETERALDQLIAARRAVLIVGEPGAGHDIAARALQTPDAPWVALANGARLTANPLALIEEAHEGTLYCAEIGQYSKAEQKGLAFLLPKLEKHNVTLVCTSNEPLGNLAAEGKFDAALLAQLSPGAVMLPPLRTRREDIPPLIERYLARGQQGRRVAAALVGAAAGRADGALQRVLARQPRPPGRRRAEPGAAARRGHRRPREAAAWARRPRPTRRSRPKSPRASSNCRCARRARPSSASISSSCWARSRAT